MKYFLLCFLLLIKVSFTYSQTQKDSIEVISDFFGTIIKQNGKILKPRDLLAITSMNSEAHKEMQMAKNNSDAAHAMGFVAGALIGWPIGTMLGGGDPQWGLAIAGGGLILLSIPLSHSYGKHATNGARIYNSGLKTSELRKTEFHIGMTGNGIGLKMKF